MAPRSAAGRVVLLAIGFIAVDQATKQLARLLIPHSQTVFIFKPFLGMRVTQTHLTVAARVAVAIFALIAAAAISVLTLMRKLRRPSDLLFAGCWIDYAVSSLFEVLRQGGILKLLIVHANSSTSRPLDLGDLGFAAAAVFWFVTFVFQPAKPGRPQIRTPSV